MVTFLGLLVLGAIVVGLVALVKRMRSTRWITVGEQVPLGVPVEDLPVLLAGLGAGGVLTPGPGQVSLVVRRCPGWVVIPVVLAFPIGLLFLLYREDVVLTVTTAPGGTAWLSGRTEVGTLVAVRQALAAGRSWTAAV